MSFLIINEARNLSRRFLEFFEFVGNVANGVHTIIAPHELIDTPHAAPITSGSGSIELKGLEFAYTPERKVFDRLDLTIPAGQRVGLVGSSGSGKSTFVSLILRRAASRGAPRRSGRARRRGLATLVSQAARRALNSGFGRVGDDAHPRCAQCGEDHVT
jgi:ABC-type transport system involved in cytochrome bd biosynthesis fused ATPase/permease subunit